ncbi:MAG: hypothetical protein JWM28_299 [Chitinophagaceae bacterium]|nr:hypothetical protein [Chitinophagaceae bacterium]
MMYFIIPFLQIVYFDSLYRFMCTILASVLRILNHLNLENK